MTCKSTRPRIPRRHKQPLSRQSLDAPALVVHLSPPWLQPLTDATRSLVYSRPSSVARRVVGSVSPASQSRSSVATEQTSLTDDATSCVPMATGASYLRRRIEPPQVLMRAAMMAHAVSNRCRAFVAVHDIAAALVSAVHSWNWCCHLRSALGRIMYISLQQCCIRSQPTVNGAT